jgi:hypothetical protein
MYLLFFEMIRENLFYPKESVMAMHRVIVCPDLFLCVHRLIIVCTDLLLCVS